MRELPSVPTSTPETLTAILGLSEQVTSGELRRAYESAMAAATGSGSLSQALRLLRAYQALPDARRRLVYGTISVDGPPRPDAKLSEALRTSRDPSPVVHRAPVESFRARVAGTVSPTRAGGTPVDARRRGYLLWAAAAPLVAVSCFLILFGGSPQATGPRVVPTSALVDHQVVATPTTAGAGTLPNSIQVARTAPVDSDGFTTVRCPRGPASPIQPAYTMHVRPGSVVSCSTGAEPVIAG